MNKQTRVDTLRKVIMHTIKGETELAESLFKQVATATGRRIALGEANYSVDDDPEFDARRELQRELEDDLSAVDGDSEVDFDGEGNDDGLGDEFGDDSEIVDAIVAKLEDGEIDDDTLAQILGLLVGEEGEAEGEVEGEADGIEGEGELDVGPADAPSEFELEDPTTLESAGGSLFDRIKFALRYEYDQFLDVDGQPEEWPAFALVDPSAELEELLASIPTELKSKYDAAIKQFIDSQVE